MEMLAEEFDIRIKDNFLNKEDFEKVVQEATSAKLQPKNLLYKNNQKDHVWFTADASKEVEEIVIKNSERFFNIEIEKLMLCKFSLVFKSGKVEAHRDNGEGIDLQSIIYIKGNEHIHCGTGFYTRTAEDNSVLNTHIGFRENRIVSWDPYVYHAPMSFTDEFKPRISLLTQYKLKGKQ